MALSAQTGYIAP